jgi:TPR repeat protein
MACYLFARCAEDGTGVPTDTDLAADYYQRAIGSNYAPAMNDYGELLLRKSSDPSTAVTFFERAAATGLPSAQVNLGWCHQFGVGVPQNPTQAFTSYQLAAKQGLAAAQYSLGVCYQQGIGTAEDPDEARRWLDLTSAQGFKDPSQSAVQLPVDSQLPAFNEAFAKLSSERPYTGGVYGTPALMTLSE